MASDDLLAAVLAAAFSGLVAENADAGIGLLASRAPFAATPAAWHEAVAKAVANGLIHDPVRLLPGALQCHWRLELTPAGFTEARRLKDSAGAKTLSG